MNALWGIFLSLLISPSVLAQTLEQTLYKQAHAAVRSNDMARFDALRARLKNYPLRPYLDYYRLAYLPSQASLSEVTAFRRQHADTPQANRLERTYLNYLADNQRWDDFLRFYPELPKSTELQCRHYEALYHQGKRPLALNAADKLWMSGASLPSGCDPLFTLWRDAGLRSQSKIWQRMTLAFRANNPQLIDHLSQQLSPNWQTYAKEMRVLYADPAKALNFARFRASSQSKTLLQLGLARYADTEPSTVLRQLPAAKKRFKLAPKAVQQIEAAIAKRLLRDRNVSERRWLNRTVKRLQQSDLLALRARLAIWEQDWSTLPDWIRALPAAEQSEEIWRYWLARALEQQGQRQPAKALYQTAAKQRSFYGFMAAQRVGAPYRMKAQALPSALEWRQASQRWPFLLRVNELLAMNEHIGARSEWVHNIDRESQANQLMLGQLALKRGWHDLAVLATIRAKAWDALALRFPLPYRDTFSRIAAQRNMNMSLLYALSRQESALYAYAESPVGARGLMQLMPATAKETAQKLGADYRGPAQLFEPQTNIRLGSAYLKRLLDVYSGNRVLAAAAYNAGPGRVRRWRSEQGERPLDVWVESIPYQETRTYVQNVLSFDLIYQHRLAKPSLQFVTRSELNHGY
ncbi:MAG: transglycosylase SLT domain-containing protein [Aeromonas sp.]